MTVAVLASLGFAVGVCLLVSGLAPRPEPLDRALARLGQPARRTTPGERGDFGETPRDLDTRLGAWLRRSEPIDRTVSRLGTDLRVLHRSPDQQAAELAGYAFAGLFWAPLVAAGCRLIGVRIPLVIPAWLAVAGAVVMVAVPYRAIRRRAAEARADFAHALSAFCDVAAMALSAGQEVHGALMRAVSAGAGSAFDELDHALQTGFLAGHRPGESLSRLGRDLGIEDLVELGGTISLAENEGAPVTDTLAGKARSIRERLIADLERQAADATERMVLPGAVLMLAFVGFIAFPAFYLIIQEAR
jgi:tight adherence protein C